MLSVDCGLIEGKTVHNSTKPKIVILIAGVLALTGCTTTPTLDADGAYRDLPEPLLALAAPYQNLNKVRLDQNDNCFWYLHDGPVERTWLPLRTVNGNAICQASS